MKYVITEAILPKKDVGVGGFRGAVLKLRWSKNNNIDVLDNQ